MLYDLTPLLAGSWLVSIILAAIVGSEHGSVIVGLLFGLAFGPLGLFAIAHLDFHPQCPACLGRVVREAGVCQHCRAKLRWKTGKPHLPQRVSEDDETTGPARWEG